MFIFRSVHVCQQGDRWSSTLSWQCKFLHRPPLPPSIPRIYFLYAMFAWEKTMHELSIWYEMWKLKKIKLPTNRWLPVQGRWKWGQCGGPAGSSRGWTLSIGRRIPRFWSPKNQNSILFCYFGVYLYLSKDVSSSLIFRDTVHIFHRLQSSLHDIDLINMILNKKRC